MEAATKYGIRARDPGREDARKVGPMTSIAAHAART